MLEWESKARAWLCSLPGRKTPSPGEIEEWIKSEWPRLPEDLRPLTTAQLHQRIIGIHDAMAPGTSQGPGSPPPTPRVSGGVPESNGDAAARKDGSWRRLCRAKHWRPVYTWLESLDTMEVVSRKDIKDWFRANPDIEKNMTRHSRYYLLHYVQRVHMKILKRKGQIHKDAEICKTRTTVKITRDGSIPPKDSREAAKAKDIRLFRKDDAFRRYELLTELQSQLEALLSKGSHVIDRLQSPQETHRCTETMSISVGDLEKENKRGMRAGESLSQSAENFLVAGSLDLNSGLKRKRSKAEFNPAWSYCETPSGSSSTPPAENIIKCLQDREQGSNWASCCRVAYVGRNKEKWIPFLQGWKSLGRQFEGPAVLFERRSYSSWVPTWCAYTSSAAVAQPMGRTDQSVQKVLDVRFHPEGLAQLVCSSNEAPNELILYNLLSGKAIQLSGHNCQVQAVEFAVRGASIVSCGGNLMKVWDATAGSCLYTLGPGTDSEGSSSVGHTKKISAMTVNEYQSYLVATSSGLGDGKLLLWNALTGELMSDLNGSLRSKSKAIPCIEAMEFCNQNLLLCGSDSSHGGPAVIQLWDVDSPQSCLSIPVNDSYITSLRTNPDCNTAITGAGDGAVDLYDIRTCGAISHLSVGSGYEVTSVSFSKCGTYFHASSTSNYTMVWDTRLMPMKRGQDDRSFSVNGLTSSRALHCLSHGKQMPTAEHAGQLPGHVDEGDQGVNDAKWLQREPVLVTVSGDGSIAMWDVALGQPCIRHLISHTRCVNTVAVAPNDDYLCTGGDDQKVVLYHNSTGMRPQRWRLSHPL